MYFLIDNERKIIFGWSAKSGCSHLKKIFWYLQNNNEDNEIHIDEKEYNSLPDEIEKYTTIIIIRNPYDRCVSGFLEKYSPLGEFRSLWKNKEITFNDFINELTSNNNNWEIIDEHHFIQQTSERFDKEKILQSKELIIYDINSIDYSFIEKIYDKKISKKLLDFRGCHENKNIILLEKNVYDLDMCLYNSYKVPTKYFYNEDIKNKIDLFYLNDFAFFKDYGFDYILNLEDK